MLLRFAASRIWNDSQHQSRGIVSILRKAKRNKESHSNSHVQDIRPPHYTYVLEGESPLSCVM